MAKVLITFLGKAQANFQDYERVSYCFNCEKPDDQGYYETDETSYFGLALRQYLSPDKTIFLGTNSSMWDALFQDDKGYTPSNYTDSRNGLTRLLSRNNEGAISEEINISKEQAWADLSAFLAQTYPGSQIGIIDYGQDDEGQLRILRQVSEFVKEGDRVSLDITHGFRHLPMITVFIALYLQHVKKAHVEQIYYGALELRRDEDAPVPVLELGGLLRIAEWVGKLEAFNKDGDYGVFENLLGQDGLDISGNPLTQAAFAERTHHLNFATDKLKAVDDALDSISKGTPSYLFKGTLRENIAWHKDDNTVSNSDERKQYYLKQRALALRYLERKDYLRSAAFAVEALDTRNLKAGEDPEDYKTRKKAKGKQSPPDVIRVKKLLLKAIRNKLAHGASSEPPPVDQNEKASVQARKQDELDAYNQASVLFEDESKLSDTFSSLIDELLPEQPTWD